MEEYSFRPAKIEEVEAISNLEAESYPADEAASPTNIRYRVEKANDFFYVLVNNHEEIAGFINGTCVKEREIHHESMSQHDPRGRTLVIHSVVTAPSFRRKKLGLGMLQEYLRILYKRKLVDRVLLLSKAYLLQFYMQAGFKVNCLSSVVHGQVNAIDYSL